jgi:hypothetical protein
MNNADIAALVVQELLDRKGFDDWYDQLDEDIQQEIVDAIADMTLLENTGKKGRITCVHISGGLTEWNYFPLKASLIKHNILLIRFADV